MKNSKDDFVEKWLLKAESDWKTIDIFSKEIDRPNDVLCFHCQQHVEKLLKALLTQNNIEFPRTHDIRTLIDLLESTCSKLQDLKEKGDILTGYGVASRYPDDWYEIEDNEVSQAVKITQEFRNILFPFFDA